MSPLGWKYSESLTKEARANGTFKDKTSKMDVEGRPRKLGKRDMEALRRKVFQRSVGFCETVISRTENKKSGGSLTVRCGRPIIWEKGHFNSMELHHVPAGYNRIHDEAHTFAICKPCHRAAHVQVRKV